MTLVAATLFSGIGTPEVAMPQWRWAWHAEIDRFPSAVMAARHPASVNLGDVSADDFTTRAAAVGRPDVLVFGSPCQSYSVAGKRLGLDDPRGNLALVALGIVDRLKPRWFVFENVPGLLSSSSGRDFGLFLRAVDEIGYSLCWSVLDAQHFGVAQRRERVFAVGYLGDWRYPAAVLLEPESLCGDHPPRREAREAVAGTLTSSLGRRSGQPNDDNPADYLISHALNAHGGPCGRMDYESETFVTHALRAEGFDTSEDGTGRGTPIVPVAFDTTQITSKTNRCRPEPGDPCHPLAAGAHPPAIAFDCKAAGNTGFSIGEIPGALRGEGFGGGHSAVAFSGRARGDDGRGYDRPPHAIVEATGSIDATKPWNVAAASAVRRLTPRECERLQGFPDDFTLITYRGKPAADGNRYKALGNSMAVPAVRWILQRLERVDRLLTSGQILQAPTSQAKRPLAQASDAPLRARRAS